MVLNDQAPEMTMGQTADSEKDVSGGNTVAEEIGSPKSEVSIDPVAEKKLIRKCDLHVVPILFVLFLLAFLDRINIGNARLQGLEKDLGMDGHDFNIALFIFFIPYILCEVPSNIILKKVAPSTWLSGIMVSWGIVTIGQGVTESFAGLVVCRFLLGVFEAGFFPGCVYLISMYYKRYEFQWRLNVFFSASILAGAFSGLLAYAIANMKGLGGYNGWRWIFIIEGIATVIVAAIAKFVIVDWPETSSFLNDEERRLLVHRLESDNGVAKMNRLDKTAAKHVFTDGKIYLGVLMYFGIVNSGYATSFFTPTILHQLGWTELRAQVMSIPIFIVATVFALGTAIATDRLRHRFAFTIIGCCVTTVGYALLICQEDVPVGARYFATFAITSGAYITQPVCVAWLSNNSGGHYKRAISSAMQIGIGNSGGLVASNIFFDNQAPTYPVGFGVSLALVWVTGLACTGFYFFIRRENSLREQGKRDYLLQLPAEEVDNLGDAHPHFRYTY